jgi:glucose/arabinose dehydrogenase
MTYWVPSIAPSGMIVYSGDAIPKWKGLVINGALAKTHLNLLEIQNEKKVAEERLFADEGTRIREVEQGPNGEVFYATDAGLLFRIRAK